MDKKIPRIGIIDAVNFDDFICGGTLTLIKNVVNHIEGEILLFGVTTKNKVNVGKWTKIKIGRKEHDFLPITYISDLERALPVRARFFLSLYRHRRQIYRSGVNVIYAHSPESAFPFLFLRKRIPVVLHLHGSANPLIHSRFAWARCRLMQKYYDKIINYVANRADRIIAVDRATLELCISIVKEKRKCYLVHNCIDLSEFKPISRNMARKQLGFPPIGKFIIYVGRLNSAKGLDLLIEAFAALRREAVEAYMIIVGEGEDRNELYDLCKTLQIDQYVNFYGRLAHEQISIMLSCADVFILTSKREGLPLVILEALACGVPIVAPDVGGIGEVISNGKNGYLFTERNASIVKDLILAALSNSEPLKKEARLTSKEFSAIEAGSHISKIIDELI